MTPKPDHAPPLTVTADDVQALALGLHPVTGFGGPSLALPADNLRARSAARQPTGQTFSKEPGTTLADWLALTLADSAGHG